MSEISIGEKRMRTEFSIFDNSNIEYIKQKTAELINLVESMKDKDPRLASLAQTTYEQAALWAEKLASE